MHFRSLRIQLLPFAFASVLCPSTAHAADGVIEINQARALAGGITPSDAPGFPVTIDTPGSYRLTSNLSVADPNATAIQITTTADGVSLDLNGFAIAGPVVCSGLSGSTLACAPSGGGSGISDGFGGHVRVRHGTVRGFGQNGIFLNASASIEDLQVISNGSDGIFDEAPTLIENSTASQNGGAGINVGSAGNGTLIQHCVVEGNHSGGIRTAGESVMLGNAVSNNGTFGINTIFSGSVIRNNEVSSNQGAGIQTSGGGSVIIHNSAFTNQGDGIDAGRAALVSDNSTNSNQGAGINADTGSAVQRNTATGNSVDGLYLVPTIMGTPPAAYRANVMDANGIFPVANGVNLGANYCNGSVCP